ncbi:hypothetical protein JB92DRAFT_3136240 [Gautieria morchelliformis]|nr:hypothetical protein JB92DRAFT_3136240 [Gautieria morchelliformis]
MLFLLTASLKIDPIMTRRSAATTIEEVPDEDSSSDFITDLEEDSDDGWEEGDNEIIGRFQILENEGLAEWDEDDLEDDDEEAATEIKMSRAGLSSKGKLIRLLSTRLPYWVTVSRDLARVARE